MKFSSVLQAVGLEYSSDKSGAVPSVCVKGSGIYAQQIVRYAKRYNIPIVERPALVKILDEIEIDEEIPEDLYEPVALILAEFENLPAVSA